MPKKPNKPVKKNPKKPKTKKVKIPVKDSGHGKTAGVALALLSIFMALPVAADNGGAHYYPYGAVTLDRLSEIEEWSTGATLGLEVTKRPLYVLVHVDLPDVLSSGSDKYPWDSLVGGGLGLYKSVDISGIAISPSAGLTLRRPSEVDQFTVGFNVTLEAAFDNVFATIGIDRHDILSTTQVYPWDQTVRVALGGYLGDSPEDDREEDEGYELAEEEE